MSEPLLKCENNAILSKTILKNCLFLLKYPILAVLGLGEILNFQISSKKSFITSTTGPSLSFPMIKWSLHCSLTSLMMSPFRNLVHKTFEAPKYEVYGKIFLFSLFATCFIKGQP